jgi:DNA-binding HxlR family transcriptional regulator
LTSQDLTPVAAEDVVQTRPTECAIGNALDALGEGWSFLILRAAFFGAHRFSEFEVAVCAPKSQLTAGLKRLVAIGVFRHHSDVGYTLAGPGKALFTLCIGFMLWGDKWAALEGQTAPPIRLAWRHDPDTTLDLGLVCMSCGSAIDTRQSTWRIGPGAFTAVRAGLSTNEIKVLPTKRRRAPDSQLLTRGQPCSVSRTIQKLGGYWGFLILREAFFGVKNFDEFVNRLGAARNVVSGRLNILVKSGVLSKQSLSGESANGTRQFYALTTAGHELFPVIVALIDWGDQYADTGNGAPITLHHTLCGSALHASLVDLRTGLKLHAVDICVT